MLLLRGIKDQTKASGMNDTLRAIPAINPALTFYLTYLSKHFAMSGNYQQPIVEDAQSTSMEQPAHPPIGTPMDDVVQNFGTLNLGSPVPTVAAPTAGLTERELLELATREFQERWIREHQLSMPIPPTIPTLTPESSNSSLPIPPTVNVPTPAINDAEERYRALEEENKMFRQLLQNSSTGNGGRGRVDIRRLDVYEGEFRNDACELWCLAALRWITLQEMFIRGGKLLTEEEKIAAVGSYTAGHV